MWKVGRGNRCMVQFKYWVPKFFVFQKIDKNWNILNLKCLLSSPASAGGVIGLTLGISMISFVEPIYFLTIRRLFVRAEERKHNNTFHPKPTKISVQPIHYKKRNDEQKFVISGIPRAWIQNWNSDQLIIDFVSQRINKMWDVHHLQDWNCKKTASLRP